MTDDEEQSAFDPWGGLLRALCESGTLGHTAQQKKAFRPCPPFAPMTKADALRALMRRYLTHYGPVTVQDAAYFFGLPQRELLPVIESLSPRKFVCEGKTFYRLEDINIIGDLSCCRFLAGFDPLMLGYEKRSNPFLPEEALRGVFTLAGIVRPSILLDGKIVGVWKRRGKAVELTWLIPLQSLQRKRIEEEALPDFWGFGLQTGLEGLSRARLARGDSSACSTARIKGGDSLSQKRIPPLEPPEKGFHCKRAARRAAMLADCTSIARRSRVAVAIRFASASIIRCCAAVGGSAALRMRHTFAGAALPIL